MGTEHVNRSLIHAIALMDILEALAKSLVSRRAFYYYQTISKTLFIENN